MSTETNIVMAFTEEQAEKLTGVSASQLRSWDRTGFFVPALANKNRSLPLSRLYSFRDLVCLKVLNALRNEANVSLQHLRSVKDRLSHLGEDMWAKTTLYVLNKKVVFENPETQNKEEVVTGQGVLQIPLMIVTGDMRRAVDEMKKRDVSSLSGKIERIKGIAGNRPVIAGTRIPVSTIKAFADEGFSAEQIIEEYPTLTLEDIQAAIEYSEAA
ncbi:DUF433 domain-containing protein [Ochrobactrum sp. MH181795]|uniref:DUF433 domain-containing protein n=1 Tax=Brucella TaxID=234 RepID=UPI000CFD9164|nr:MULTISPECIES: DUF433 domain-containing protein [Brucella/Ochrobactrum group]MCB4920041.1 DUF433 domain-containing protein [Brucella intermedia]PQZ62739.1 hypothetical protein CQ057_14935 [Ochrobactrum sp. MYb49]RNL46354.1 DUF433 domain-containing protein [Ochrobactrum sp. MH181795]